MTTQDMIARTPKPFDLLCITTSIKPFGLLDQSAKLAQIERLKFVRIDWFI